MLIVSSEVPHQDVGIEKARRHGLAGGVLLPRVVCNRVEEGRSFLPRGEPCPATPGDAEVSLKAGGRLTAQLHGVPAHAHLDAIRAFKPECAADFCRESDLSLTGDNRLIGSADIHSALPL